jgi:hypothetical protein
MTYTKSLHLFLGSLCLLASQAFAAFVINEGLDNSGTDSGIRSDGNNSAKAVNFVMGPGSDYTLDSIVLGLDFLGTTGEPIVQLWSDDGTSTPIGSSLETLSNPGTLTGSGTFTFTSSGTTLAAATTYWVVVRNDNVNEFDWLGDNGPGDTNVTSDIGATHTARLFGNPGSPGDWDSSSSVLNQIQVNATVIPEPSTLLLSALAGCALIFIGRRRR